MGGGLDPVRLDAAGKCDRPAERPVAALGPADLLSGRAAITRKPWVRRVITRQLAGDKPKDLRLLLVGGVHKDHATSIAMSTAEIGPMAGERNTSWWPGV